VDDWLTQHRASGDDGGTGKDSRRVRLGLGMFLIQGEPAEEEDDK
jgi:hypothetical protein